MCIKSSWLKPAGVRLRVAQIVMAMAGALVLSLPSAALAQTTTVCGATVKEDVLRALAAVENASDEEKARVEAELYQRYLPCAGDPAPSSFATTAKACGASVAARGSIFYEEMPCCGYDPQRRQF